MNKPIRFLLTALMGLSLLSFNANAQCPGNLIANPGFEANLNGWTVVGPASLSTDAHSGSHAADLTSAGFGSIGYLLPATPGTSYTMSAWTKYTCSVELRFLNSSWNKLPGSAEQQSASVFYQQTTLSGTAPAGTAYVYVFFAKDGNGSFKVDDACLTLGGGPACAITPTVSNIVCSNNNTPANPNDDTYSFTVNATNATGTGYQMAIPQLNQTYSGTYGSPMYIQYLPISAGNLTLNFTDNTTPSCTATASVTAPPPCSVTGLPDLDGLTSEIIPGTNNCFTAPGQSFVYFSVMIRNIGDVPATAFKVKFYFSTDNMLSANDLLWSTVNLTSLNVLSNGGPAFISPGQPVPASLAPGQYYVLVTIDEGNQVTESNEANNMLLPYLTQIGSPDVILDSYSGIPATVAAGSSFNMQVTVKYLANGFNLPASTSFPVEVFIPATGSNIALGSVNYTLGDFSQSNSVTKTVQVTVPASVPTGTQTIRMNASTSFCEPVYPNNFKDQPVTVTTGGGNQIDLELAMQQNTANPVIYSNYTTTLTLVNKGPQAATGVKVKWAKPAGVVYTGGNEFTASQGSFNPNGDQVWTVGSLPANGTATLKVSYFLLQNGAPVTYAQVIAADQPDVDSQPNNGTPPAVNQDDEASTGGSAPPVLTPDLTISNLVLGNAPVQPGQILTYNFDLANIGNGNVPGDFVVRAWISTQPYFNTTGIQDGIVPTGNFNAGFSVSGVPGASTIPANLADGQYYLHLLVDADYVVSEINEWNNSATASFVVHGLPQPGTCDELLGPGTVSCLSHDANGQLEIIYKPATDLRRAVLDGTGQPILDETFGPDPLVTSYQVNLGKLEKTVGQAVVYSKTVPAAILNEYNYIVGFTEFNTGYILFGFKTATAGMYALRTNANLEVQQTALLTTSYNGIAPNVYNTGQLSPTEIRFVLRSQPGQQIAEANTLYVMNGDLTVASTELLTSGIFSGGVTLVPNACGNYSMVIFRQTSFCTHGACYEQERRLGRFENGHFITDASYLMNEFSSLGSGTLTRIWKLRTIDGGLITGNVAQQVYLGQPNNNVPIHLKKTLGTATVWEKDINVASVSAVRWLAMSGNELVFLSEKVNAVFVEALSCVETPAPPTGCAAIQISAGANSLSIAGATAPHVLIKVFNPNWTLNAMCLDNCANPFAINNLTAGTYHLQIKLLDNGWGEICYLERDVTVNGFGSGSSNSLARSDERHRLWVDNCYPSPASYQVTVDVFSPVEQAATLDFYDQLGRPVHSMKLQLDKGSNAVPVLVYDWKSGSYNVIVRGEQMQLPAYGRFLKVWEE